MPRQTKRRCTVLTAKQRRLSEADEIKLLEEWMDAMKPERGTNPLAVPPPPSNAPIGRLPNGGGFSAYAGATLFSKLPISRKTKDGLAPFYTEMSEIQRASLPHSLCGRDILGAAKTGSGKTLAFLIPVIEKLYRAQWGSEDGVGSIIISPTKELAGQLFKELNKIGKYHNLSAGLLVGGRKDVNLEKERVNGLNILVCTPGRLLQHLDETPNFDCSQLQILVLDEADRILDRGFKVAIDAIISQLPRVRQTLLFSATQTKSVKDLARISLNNPEYISVHEESKTATPEGLKQFVMIVPLHQKLDFLWSFIRKHLQSKVLVFLSSCKQVKYVYEAFKKLRPGIPLKCLHGRMSLTARMAMCAGFSESTSVLFATDAAARGLDIPLVDWVVQVDCPEDVSTYIHRVGRTARFRSQGRSLMFLCPEEKKMLERMESAKPKIPCHVRKPREEVEQISKRMAAIMVQYPQLQQLAKRAFVTYLKSIYLHKDKEVFDVNSLPINDFAASLGLPMTPRINFIKRRPTKVNGLIEDAISLEDEKSQALEINHQKVKTITTDAGDDDILLPKNISRTVEEAKPSELGTRVLKKKKVKINIHRPSGTRVKYDEDGNVLAPLATIADKESENAVLHVDKVRERYSMLRDNLKEQDKDDKLLQKKRRREKRMEQKMKLKRLRVEEDADSQDSEQSNDEATDERPKRSKIYFDSDNDDDNTKERSGNTTSFNVDHVTIEEQEALALKLLESIHS